MRNLWMIFVFSFLCCFISGTAQQTVYTNFYRYSWQLLNPAAIDKLYLFNENQSMVLSASARQQWVGLEGAPVYYQLSFEHMPSQDNNNSQQIKWGFNVFKDQAGQISNYGIYGNFAYYIPLPYTKGKYIHFGISPGLIQYRVDYDKIKFREQGESFTDTEPNRLYADFSLGIFYRHQKTFYAGLSIPQTFGLDLSQRQDNGLFAKERLQHVYGLIGGFINLQKYSYTSKGSWIIEPSAWFRYVPGITYASILENFPLSADFDCRLYYGPHFWFGAGYSTTNNIKIEAGINKGVGGLNGRNQNKLRFGFSWNLPVSSGGPNLGTSIEINAAYAWDY